VSFGKTSQSSPGHLEREILPHLSPIRLESASLYRLHIFCIDFPFQPPELHFRAIHIACGSHIFWRRDRRDRCSAVIVPTDPESPARGCHLSRNAISDPCSTLVGVSALLFWVKSVPKRMNSTRYMSRRYFTRKMLVALYLARGTVTSLVFPASLKNREKKGRILPRLDPRYLGPA